MALTNEDLNDLYDMTEGCCFYCGMRLAFCNYGYVGTRGAWEADHFIPVSRRGSCGFYNLVPACVHCNTVKADLMPWEFDPDRFRRGDRDPQDYVGGAKTILRRIFG
jgi:5-methylcytosine-specific restriction endonuclease McrA